MTHVTLFPDLRAHTLQARNMTFDEIVEGIGEPEEYRTKTDCPLIVMAEFGQRRSRKGGSLRWAGNILGVHGVECDYDSEVLPLEEAAEKLRAAGVRTVLYTSASHRPEAPRWRVLAPLSQRYLPRERKKFVARINGVLGGVLAPESFVLAQSFYIGRVVGAVYEWARTDGECIDLLDELDAVAVGAQKNGARRAERVEEIRSTDPVVSRLAELGLVREQRADGTVVITCPFEGEHTTPGGADGTVYFPPHTGGYATGNFCCRHSHCADRKQAEFREAVGIERCKPEAGEPPAVIWPDALDMLALSETEPKPPEFLVPQWLPCDYATLLAGHGGAGKSQIALHLAVCIALGLPFFGLPVEQRRVLYLSCEDRACDLHWRLKRICNHLRRDISELHQRLDLIDLVGINAILWAPDPRGGKALTPSYGELAARIRDAGREVVFLDGITDTYGGNENDKGQVKQFVNEVVGLIPSGGAVVLLGHVAKFTANTGAGEAYSGTTGWHNAVRARWYLRAERDEGALGTTILGETVLELQKTNHGKPSASMKFKWDDDAGMFLGEAQASAFTNFDRKQRDRAERDGILAALRACEAARVAIPSAKAGFRTAYHALSENPAFPESLRDSAGRSRFWRHMEALQQSGDVRRDNFRKPDRHCMEIFATAVLQDACGPSAGLLRAIDNVITPQPMLAGDAVLRGITPPPIGGSIPALPQPASDDPHAPHEPHGGSGSGNGGSATNAAPQEKYWRSLDEKGAVDRLEQQKRTDRLVAAWERHGWFGKPGRSQEDAERMAAGLFRITGEIVLAAAGHDPQTIEAEIAAGRSAPTETVARWAELAKSLAAGPGPSLNGEAF